MINTCTIYTSEISANIDMITSRNLSRSVSCTSMLGNVISLLQRDVNAPRWKSEECTWYIGAVQIISTHITTTYHTYHYYLSTEYVIERSVFNHFLCRHDMYAWQRLLQVSHQQQACRQRRLLYNLGYFSHCVTEGHQEGLLPGQKRCCFTLLWKHLQCCDAQATCIR